MSGTERAAPPGYADPAAVEVAPPGLRPATILVALWAVVAALLGASVRELLARAPAVFVVPLGGSTISLWLAGGTGAVLGAYLGTRRRSAPHAALSLSTAALFVAVALPLWYRAFRDQARFTLESAALAGASAFVLALATVSAFGYLGRHAIALELPFRALAPARLAFAALALSLALGVAAHLPPLHAASVLGAGLALCAAGIAPLHRFLWRERLPRRFSQVLPGLALAGSLFCLLDAERRFPLEESRHFAGSVALFAGGARQRLHVVSAGAHYELYVDRALRVSGLDAARYAEALVQPALLVAPRRERVLLLGGGTGLVEREILRSPEVRELHAIVTDRALPALVRVAPWPGAAARRALADPRLAVHEAEPIVWLDRTPVTERFDVIVVDVEDPIGPREGKHYTRRFYELVASHLADDGVLAAQLPSPLGFPAAFSSALATLRAAGLDPAPYRAALPALGEWGFAVAAVGRSGGAVRASLLARTARLPRDLRYVTPEILPSLLALPNDWRLPAAPPNTLFDQPIVELYEDENARRP